MDNELNMSFKVHAQDFYLEVNGKKYFWKEAEAAARQKNPSSWRRRGCVEAELALGRSHFSTGVRNIFLWNEDENFGYKIFTQAKFQNRRIYHCLWQENWPLPYHAVLGKEEVELMHFLYNELYKRGRGAKSHGLVKFNNSFWGLKLERVIIDESNEKLAGDLINDEYKKNLREVWSELGMDVQKLEICPQNSPFCTKLNKLVHIDIDYMHMKFMLQ